MTLNRVAYYNFKINGDLYKIEYNLDTGVVTDLTSYKQSNKFKSLAEFYRFVKEYSLLSTGNTMHARP